MSEVIPLSKVYRPRYKELINLRPSSMGLKSIKE